ncbi:MAG: VCBS repeat-containing protein, partial [Gemmataceae bacterium]|nr:VCBS repeat-containing protein [Gemmataceae bacterium]
MRRHRAVLVLIVLTPAAAVPAAAMAGESIAWKRIVVDQRFRAEGVAVVDVNKDGKKDIVVGDVWYAAPDWQMHLLAKERAVSFKDWGNVIDKGWSPIGRPGMTGYSESFAVFADDFNGDGWPDVIVLPFPGKECHWYQNPGPAGGLWKQHLLSDSACNETPIFIDLFGKGKKYLVMAWQPPGKGNMGEMCWFEPGSDPTQPWSRHSLSGPSTPMREVPGTRRFSHGLGHGDVNGDGRIDIICTGGWWEQPARREQTPWTFHAAQLGPDCADMHVYDVDGDGKNDILSSSAHLYGMWWHQQKAPSQFIQRELFP